jgi:hypothetical protein
MSNKTMSHLLKIQAEQKKDLAAGVHVAWLAQQEAEQSLLEPFNYRYDQASQSVKDRFDKSRKEFLAEWGSDGRLAALMESRHAKEREVLAIKLKLSETLATKDKDHDRGI